MSTPPFPLSSTENSRPVLHHKPLDQPPSDAFEDILNLATQICTVPVAVINLIGYARVWMKLSPGTVLLETKRGVAFYSEIVGHTDDPAVIDEAAKTSDRSTHVFVADESGLRFYASILLRTEEGRLIGNLSVIDHQPHTLGAAQQDSLRILGRQIMLYLELRRSVGEKELKDTLLQNSQKKRSVEQLLEKTAFLEAQVDASLDGILVVDAAGKKILQNRRLIDLLQIPAWLSEQNDDEKTFQFVAGIIRNSDAFIAKVVHLYSHPDETSRDEIELKDGTTLDRYSSPVRGKDGTTYGRIWTFRDITAQKASVKALQQSEERFKFVARAVSDVVWDWDLRSGTLWWNEGFLTTFGFSATEFKPSVAFWTERIHAEDRLRITTSLQSAIKSIAEVWSGEYRFQRKDGTYAFVQDRGYLLRSDTGAAFRMVGGMRDLTEQKKMEAQYMRSERMDSIGTLAGGIAHDLNNVLSPIMLSIELLKQDTGFNARRGKILDIIQTSSRRGADLVRQVLAFARGIEGQRVPLRLQPVIADLESIISETFPRNIRIVTKIAVDLWNTVGDSSQLHQVLLNLAVNGRDAMPEGGTLSFEATNILIDAQYAGMSSEAQPGPYLLLQVTDTGQGIPPEVIDRIFEPFFTTKELGKGTGIGLATVHTVVRSHGGFLEVESETGQGTTFKIYLPAEPGANTPQTPPEPAASLHLPRGHDELVLLVDDEPAIQQITRETLESFGYRVLLASDGAEAVALYAQKSAQISVVLTDMMMPIMDGAAMIQVLLRINPAVKIIATSGIESSLESPLTRRAGVQAFILKPYSAEAVLSILADVIAAPADTRR